MPPFPNLISDSVLINDTIALLKSRGGALDAARVVSKVMNMRPPTIELAHGLISDLIERDPRLAMSDGRVHLVENAFDHRRLRDTSFVVFDLETTGASAPPCRITEIGAYRIEKGRITDKFETLVNPQTPIPPFITDLTKISNEMVKDAPVFGEVAGSFLNFIDDSILIAHNAHFDMSFLNYEIGMAYPDYRMANPCLCTVQLSRKLLPDILNHKLKTVAAHYAISLENHHRAGDDARATAEIFVNLLSNLDELGVADLGSLRRLILTKRFYVG